MTEDAFRPGWWDAVPVVARTLKELYPQNPDVVLGREARTIVQALHDAGLVILPDEPHHYVTFDDNGWFIEHSVECRVNRTLGTCEHNDGIRQFADRLTADNAPLGRWLIRGFDAHGTPALDRADLSGAPSTDGQGAP